MLYIVHPRGETGTLYTEEILKMCTPVKPSISEDVKAAHLLDGIAEDVYQFLIVKENLTSASVVKQHCRTFGALKMRSTAPKNFRLSDAQIVARVNASPPFDLSSTIWQLLRQELICCYEISRFGGYDSQGNERGLPPVSWQPSVYAANVNNYQAVPEARTRRLTSFKQ